MIIIVTLHDKEFPYLLGKKNLLVIKKFLIALKDFASRDLLSLKKFFFLLFTTFFNHKLYFANDLVKFFKNKKKTF